MIKKEQTSREYTFTGRTLRDCLIEEGTEGKLFVTEQGNIRKNLPYKVVDLKPERELREIYGSAVFVGIVLYGKRRKEYCDLCAMIDDKEVVIKK